MKVLVVSENVKERLRASTALRLHGDVEVVEAFDARQARRHVIEGGVDVLVIDGDLQPKGGFSLLYEIRQQAEQEDTTSPPALVMIARDQDRWLGGWAGANQTMNKPVDPFELASAVKSLAGDTPALRATSTSEEEVAAVTSTEGSAGLSPDAH